TADRAAPGVDVTVTLVGVVKAPCRVVWTVEEHRRAGWAYGTLSGHPESGEEAFVVHRTGDGTVWLTVSAFSRPASWYARAGGPATRSLQHAYARRAGKTLRRLATRGVEEAWRLPECRALSGAGCGPVGAGRAVPRAPEGA